VLRLHRGRRPLAAHRAAARALRLGGLRGAGRRAARHRRRQVGDTFADKKSIDWHLVYDPWPTAGSARAPLPTGRDHVAAIPHGGLIHVIGGRVDSFHTNSNLHHAYDRQATRWEARNPLPTARSGHGAAILDGRIFVMGGEGTNRVFGQNEGYDLEQRHLEQYARCPRHATAWAPWPSAAPSTWPAAAR
jgi:hypothetical protein